MTTVYESLKPSNRGLNRLDGDVGIEIETETATPYSVPTMGYWATHQDGSLRNFGIEYVLKMPVKVGKELNAALEEFASSTSKLSFMESISTSVHVHLNFLNETWRTVARFFTVYTLFENVLVRYSGPDRLSNLFCLPIKDAEGCLDYIYNILRSVDEKRFNRIQQAIETCKYSALNVATLHSLGTLEVRTFRGVHDPVIIKKWVDILYALREFARIDKFDPVSIIELYRDDPAEFFQTVFGDLASEFPWPDRVQLVERNLWYAAKIATQVKSWKEYGEKKLKPINQELMKPKLDSIALGVYGTPYANLNVAQRIVVEEMFYEEYPRTSILPVTGDR